ncbi:hypothetical protein C8R45DRAFT_943280 [Mycena sanguinolenta]|nr:hypothetical protein C8R45DRAFT_943280 [Mycena sanguinolenta]
MHFQIHLLHSSPTERRIQLLRACWRPVMITALNTCMIFTTFRLFQTLNCLGKLTAYNFLRGLEMCTNHDGLDKPPKPDKTLMVWSEQDRQKPFMHIMRQWREVKRHKQAKRGHKAGGVMATSLGELDANFKLSNRSVSSEAADPFFGDRWGYFCKRSREDGYNTHVAKHADETELSNCSGFQAMLCKRVVIMNQPR